MADQRCGVCRFSDMLPTVKFDHYGNPWQGEPALQCIFNPPAHRLNHKDQPYVSRWPIVDAEKDRCGQFKRDIKKS